MATETEGMLGQVQYLSIDDVLDDADEISLPPPPVFNYQFQPASASSTNSVSDLTLYIQKNNIPPPAIDVYDSPPFSSRFLGTLKIDGWIEEVTGGPHGSKKSVKEELCRKALEQLKVLVIERGWTGRQSVPGSPKAVSNPPRVVLDEGVFMETTSTPKLVGVVSSNFMADLNHMCQVQGLAYPELQIDLYGKTFRGTITLPGIARLKTAEGAFFRSKREAKEALAEAAIEKLKEVAAQRPTPISPGANSEMYVGKLNTFCGERKLPLPTYEEFQAGGRFSVEVKLSIPEASGRVFGNRYNVQPSKKAAKLVAAREAWKWIEENGLANSKSLLRETGACVLPNDRVLNADLMLLARHLQISEPTFTITGNPEAPGIHDVETKSVDLDGNVVLYERVGSVIGKKNARRVASERILYKMVILAESRAVKIVTKAGAELTSKDFYAGLS